jgi:hypothetical protein
MNIIFGNAIHNVPNSYTILELDTFRLGDGSTSVAYCVVEKIPLADFDKLEAYKKVHADLLTNYRAREWTYCEHAIEGLMGKWNGELDSFYSNLLLRVIEYKQNAPGPNWDGILIKSSI